MTPEEKIGCKSCKLFIDVYSCNAVIFALYDFDESSVLSLDEMVLAFRSTLSGLSKLSKVNPPTEADVELIVVQGFELLRGKKNKKSGGDDFDTGYIGIEKDEFLKFCLDTPEIMSWIEYFDDLEEYELELTGRKLKIPTLPQYMERDTATHAAMNPTVGGRERLEYERKGFAKDFMPKKNWENAIPFLAPSRMPDHQRETPYQNVILDWAYGYNSYASRQNLYYTAHGELIYPAGAVVVIQNVPTNTQRHFVEHTDLITCLKCYHTVDGKTIVATGECGQRPAVHVWDVDSRRVLATLRGFHRNGIVQLDFSPDRSKLVTLGMDPYFSLAVYNWKSGERLWASRTSLEAALEVRFLSDTLLSSCGKDHIIFWSENVSGGYTRFRGLFGSAFKPETMFTVACVGDIVVSGSESGMLYVWEGRNLVRGIKAHTGVINAMNIIMQGSENGLVTACSAGKIQIWNSKLEIGATFNATTLGPIEPPIVSVCWDTVTQKILIGFKTCEIYEMDSTDGRNAHNAAIASGHYNVRVSCVAQHPLNPKIFCSIGSDKSVRIFDSSKHKQLKVALLDTIPRSCVYSPDGQLIYIGLGSGITGHEERKEGAHVVLKEEDLTIVHEARDSKGAINCVKISPAGDIMALGSADGAIYVYNTSDYAAKAKCRGHNGRVLHMDFSSDGQYLISNCSAGDMLFWDVEKGEQQAAKLMRDVQWETSTCVYSFIMQGIWGPYADDVDVMSACKSNAGDIIASLDNFGRLRIFICPCVKDYSNFLLARAHAADGQCVRFACDDGYLYTSGGADGCVFQWRVTTPEVQDVDEMKKFDEKNEQLLTEIRFEGKLLDRTPNQEYVLNDVPMMQCLLEEGEAEMNDMLPWQRTIIAPSSVPLENNSEPPDTLELEFVNGFAADRCRESLKYTHSSQVAFISSGIAVVMDQTLRSQNFYQDHSASITAMAVHPTENFVATGQLGEVPAIRVWNSLTMETIVVLEGFHRRAIVHLAFSPHGDMLASVGGDKYHSLAIYNWRYNQIISYTLTFSPKSFFIGFNPTGTSLIQCGHEIIRFWEIDGLNLRYLDALFTTRSKMQPFLCAGWIGSHPVVGTADGSLYRFVGRNLDGMIQAHQGNVNAIASSNDGICSGGADGVVKIWNRTLECMLVVDTRTLRSVQPNVRCVDWDVLHSIILIGTMSSEVFEISALDGEPIHKNPLLQGHAGAELWGLSVNPLKDQYCTVGDDSMLRIWNIVQHTVVISLPLEMPARSCVYSPDGRKIAIGYGSPVRTSTKQYDGKWVVLDAEDLQVSHEARDSNKWITDMKYSPNGEMLAIGSFDNRIYVYNVLSGYSLSCTINQHNSFISHLDFSDDNAWLQSNCGGFELCFFEADTGMFIPAASRLRDVRWATQTCVLGWAVQGVWPAQRDGTDVTACDCNLFRGDDGTIIATGDNYGRVQVFRYPATSSFCTSKRYRTGSSPVTRMKFVSGDAYLVTLHGADKSIMQWKHTRDRGEFVAHNVLSRAGKVDEDEEDIIGFFGLEQSSIALPDLKDIKNMITSRPWIASIVAPSDVSILMRMNDAVPPQIKVELSHVFGLQADNTRNSIRYNVRGDAIYPASRYVCVYNKKSNTQLYYMGHDKSISCVGVSVDGKIAASAAKCGRPQIHVWDASTCEILAVLPLLHRRGVASIQFSSDRKKIISVGQDPEHTVAVWESPSGEWFDGRLEAWNKGDVFPVLFGSFYSHGSFACATGGRFHVKFWQIDGRCLNSSYAEYEPSQKLGTMLCGTSVGRDFVSGSNSGHLFVWQGRKLDRVVRAHAYGVSCIWSGANNVVTSAKDGNMKIWTLKLEHVKSFTLADAAIPPLRAGIRSIDVALSQQEKDKSSVTRLLIGTAGGDIYELAAESGNICLVHESHHMGELWGLGINPADPDIFVTCCDDNTIRVWSVSHKHMLRKAVLDCTARCISFSPDGKLLIVGLGGSWDGKRQRKDGAFLILDAMTLKPLFEGR